MNQRNTFAELLASRVAIGPIREFTLSHVGATQYRMMLLQRADEVIQ